MSRDIQTLQNHKADVTMIVSEKPRDTEGNNGDFAVGNTTNGVFLFMKVQNKWYEISADKSLEIPSQIQGSVFYLKSGWDHDSGLSPYSTQIPMQFVQDATGTFDSDGADNEKVVFILPYDCRVLRLQVRATSILGDSYAELYSATNGYNVTSSDFLIETTPTNKCPLANVVYSLDFSGAVTLPANDIIVIKLVSTGVQSNMTSVLTLDFDVIT